MADQTFRRYNIEIDAKGPSSDVTFRLRVALNTTDLVGEVGVRDLTSFCDDATVTFLEGLADADVQQAYQKGHCVTDLTGDTVIQAGFDEGFKVTGLDIRFLSIHVFTAHHESYGFESSYVGVVE